MSEKKKKAAKKHVAANCESCMNYEYDDDDEYYDD